MGNDATPKRKRPPNRGRKCSSRLRIMAQQLQHGDPDRTRFLAASRAVERLEVEAAIEWLEGWLDEKDGEMTDAQKKAWLKDVLPDSFWEEED